MESKRRALGRGLEELFNNEPLDYDKLENKIIEETSKDEIIEIPISELRSNPYQPRKYFDESALDELASSIKEHGVFQPIIVKKSIKGYEIIAGERRVKASALAGKEKIPAIVRDFSDKDMMEIALLENLQRENLNAIEEATAYKKLQENLNLTQEELASHLGKSRSHITNMLGLLKLPEEVKDLIMTNHISMGHARAISKMDYKEEMILLANRIVDEKLSVRQVEELTSNGNFHKKNQAKKPKREDYTYKPMEEFLCDKLGTKVKIKNNKLSINFTNAEDLNRILEILNVEYK